MSSGIIGFKRSTVRRLWMTHFSKSSTHRNGFLSVEEKTAGFSFGGRGSNSADGLA